MVGDKCCILASLWDSGGVPSLPSSSPVLSTLSNVRLGVSVLAVAFGSTSITAGLSSGESVIGE